MTDSTHGLPLPTRSRPLRAAAEVLSSMRFAIALLTVICIASVIGTVLKQQEPLVNYVNQFGPFWSQVFIAVKLHAVYSAWWFLLILAFLVISTSLCIARHTPKYLADLRNYKENIRVQNLQAFHHKAQATLAQESPEAAAQRIGALLVSGGWKVRLQERRGLKEEGWMVAAKTGGAHKIGYIAAHSAIVLICLGGLLDGDLVVRTQMWLGDKTPWAGGGMIADVKPEHVLSERNPTYRGDLFVSEGASSSTAILSQYDGVLLQPLPFTLELKKFTVEHYETGMPKLFASEIVLRDKATGETQERRIEVNHPVNFAGVEIYQAGFDDGGSLVTLTALPLQPGGKDFEVQGRIGGQTALQDEGSGEAQTLEFTALRVFNVEDLSDGQAPQGETATKTDLRAVLDARLGAGNKTTHKKALRNVGPSITYKLRDSAGQAREFHNYMLPMDMGEGRPVFLLGVRENATESFRYLRLPADRDDSLDGFIRLRQALGNPALREQAVARFVARAIDGSRPDLAQQLHISGLRAMELFAGAKGEDGQWRGGLPAISDSLEANVPTGERDRAAEVLMRILNGSLFELAQLAQEKAAQPPLEPSDARTQAFMTQAVIALSDAQIYPTPFVFTLKDYQQVQASIFQVARAPGKNIVYLGCALLILGIFAMLYIRDRRIWVWLTAPEGGAATQASMALSTNRKTFDGNREFADLSHKLIGAQPQGVSAP